MRVGNTARLPADVFDHTICVILLRLVLSSHHLLLKCNDEPKSLPYAINSFCLYSADGGQLGFITHYHNIFHICDHITGICPKRGSNPVHLVHSAEK